MKPFGFSKNERLCSKKAIDTVFSEGKNKFSFPLKARFTIDNLALSQEPLQALFVVPKRAFKKAVTRNAIRRRIKEAYRLNKHVLIEWCIKNEKSIRLIFFYLGTENPDFSKLQKSIQNIIKELTGRT